MVLQGSILGLTLFNIFITDLLLIIPVDDMQIGGIVNKDDVKAIT